MKCNLEIECNGGNASAVGQIELDDGVVHQIECHGSESDRGMYATIDGVKFWWWGSDENKDNPQLEGWIECILDDTCHAAEEIGLDYDGNFTAKVIDGKVTEIQEIADEDED